MTRRTKLLWIMIVVSFGLIAAIVWDHFDRTEIPDNNTLIQFFQDTVVTAPGGDLSPVVKWSPPLTTPDIRVGRIAGSALSDPAINASALDGELTTWLQDLNALTGLVLTRAHDTEGEIQIELTDETGGPEVHNSAMFRDHRIVRATITVRTGDLTRRYSENCETEREDCITADALSRDVRARMAKGLVRALGLRGSPRQGRSILRNDDRMTTSDALALHILYQPELRAGSSALAAIDFVSTNADSFRTSPAVLAFIGRGE